jgi:hypothetical protein
MLPLFLGSCLKKLEEIEETNSNIFDREYNGDRWYNVNSLEQISNELGEIKARFDAQLPRENLPGLLPSYVEFYLQGDGITGGVIGAPLAPGGNFDFEIDLPYTGAGEYCISLGIYIEEENETINIFEYCATL